MELCSSVTPALSEMETGGLLDSLATTLAPDSMKVFLAGIKMEIDRAQHPALTPAAVHTHGNPDLHTCKFTRHILN